MSGPSATEQLLLEYVDEARLDPLRDAARFISGWGATATSADAASNAALAYFGVSGPALYAALSSLTPVQPLAWSESLGTSARAHDQAMIAADTQAHVVAGEAGLLGRTIAAGYHGAYIGENIYAYSQSALYAHAGFMVDWGTGTDGMQAGAGHRQNIMFAAFREIGVGIVADSDPATAVGPLVVTEDLGVQPGSNAFVLGVAYTDSDHDGFYSIGEGLGTLAVTVGADATTSYASGGYTLSTALTGAQPIVFSGGGLAAPVTALVNLAAGSNVKLDIVNGNELRSSTSAVVSGPIAVLRVEGATGISLTATGTGAHTLIGGSGADTLTGSSGADVIVGGAGADTLTGGAGADVFRGTAAEMAGDTITDFTAADRIDFTGVSLASLAPTLAGNVLSFNGGAITLAGLGNAPHTLAAGSDGAGGVTLRLVGTSIADLNADGTDDLVFRSSTGTLAAWTTAGGAMAGGGTIGNPGAYRLVATGDLDGDGAADLVFRGRDGRIATWQMDGETITGGGLIGNPGAANVVVGSGDFNGDGKTDILFYNAVTGGFASWYMAGTAIVGSAAVAGPGAGWVYKGAGDFNGDGKPDMLFENASGGYATWQLDGLTVTGGASLGNPGADWFFKGLGDFDGDGRADALFERTDGTYGIWNVSAGGGAIAVIGNPGAAWSLAAIGDYNGDGTADLMFRRADGSLASWLLEGATLVGGASLGNPGAAQSVAAGHGANDFAALVFQNDDGTVATWKVNLGANVGGGTLGNPNGGNPGAGYVAKAVADFAGTGETDVLFQAADGTLALWKADGAHLLAGGTIGSPNLGNQGAAYAFTATGDFNGDGKADILFTKSDGSYATWDMSGSAIIGGGSIGVAAGYQFVATCDLNGDGKDDVLFQAPNGTYAAWFLNDTSIVGGGTIGNPGTGWSFKGTGDFNGDGKADLLFENAAGTYATWDLDGTAIVGGGTIGNPGGSFALAKIADLNADGRDDLVFRDASGKYAGWLLADTTILAGANLGTLGSGWHLV